MVPHLQTGISPREIIEIDRARVPRDLLISYDTMIPLANPLLKLVLVENAQLGENRYFEEEASPYLQNHPVCQDRNVESVPDFSWAYLQCIDLN